MKGNNIAAQLREVTEGLEPTDAQALLRVAQKVSKETRAEKEAHLRYLLLEKDNQQSAKKLQELAGTPCRRDSEGHPPITADILGAACDTVYNASSPLVAEPTQPVPSTLVAAPTTTPPVSLPLEHKPASPSRLEVIKGFLCLCLSFDYGDSLRDVSPSRVYRSACLWTLLYFVHCL